MVIRDVLNFFFIILPRIVQCSQKHLPPLSPNQNNHKDRHSEGISLDCEGSLQEAIAQALELCVGLVAVPWTDSSFC